MLLDDLVQWRNSGIKFLAPKNHRHTIYLWTQLAPAAFPPKIVQQSQAIKRRFNQICIFILVLDHSQQQELIRECNSAGYCNVCSSIQRVVIFSLFAECAPMYLIFPCTLETTLNTIGWAPLYAILIVPYSCSIFGPHDLVASDRSSYSISAEGVNRSAMADSFSTISQQN